MATKMDPYEKWLGIRNGGLRLNYYQLLGLATFESDDAIIDHAAQRQLAKIKSLAAAEHTVIAKVVADEIMAARNALLSPTTKRVYDQHLRGNPAQAKNMAIGTGQSSDSSSSQPTSRSRPAPAPTTLRIRPIHSKWRIPFIVASAFVTLVALVGITVVLRADKEHKPTSSMPLLSDGRGPDAEKSEPKTESPAAIEPFVKNETKKEETTGRPPTQTDSTTNETLPSDAGHPKRGRESQNESAATEPVQKPLENKGSQTSEVQLTDGTVVKLENYGKTYEGYDWKPPIDLYSAELHSVLEFGTVTLNFDVEHDRMYWSTYIRNHQAGQIQRASLDGNHVENLVTDLYEPRGLAVDFARGKMFWTEVIPGTSQHFVKRADLDGHNVQTIVHGVTAPTAIAVDPETGNVFFFESPNERHIHRIRPDGGGETSIIKGHVCDKINVDSLAGKLYLSQVQSQQIWQANLDGSQMEIIADAGWGSIRSVSFNPDETKFYSTNGSQLNRFNRDGSQVETLVIEPPRKRNPEGRIMGSVAVLPQTHSLYLTGHRYTYRMGIPPLPKAVTKPAPPKIVSMTPAKQSPGRKVVVVGTGFGRTTKVALFDDSAGGEVPVDFELLSETKLSFDMPKLSENCRHVAVIVLTPGGVTVTLPTSLSVASPRIATALPETQAMNTKTTKGAYGNIWYVVGQHQKIPLISQEKQTGLGRVDWSLVYVEPHASAGTGDRGYNVIFLKDGAVSSTRQWRSVVYHEPFAVLAYNTQESREELKATFIPVSAIRPSFVPELLEYEQPQ